LANKRLVKIQFTYVVLVVLVALLGAATGLVGCAGSVSASKSAQTPQPPASSLKISTTSLPNGVVGQTYQGSLVATGGSSPYLWSVASGALPNGLSINSASGAISGQPSKAATFSFMISVQDSSAAKASAQSQMSMQVGAAPVPPTGLQISTTSLPGGQVGNAYDGSMVATGGTPPYSWSVGTGSLPSGLGLSSTSGVISGQPTAAGSFSFAIGVQDSSPSKASAQAAMSVQIVAAPVPPPKTTKTKE
jgi:hypothetical protein